MHGDIHFHAAPAAPVTPTTAGQVVTGLIPHEPPNFQTPRQVAALAGMTGEVCVVCAVTGQRGVGKTQVAAAYARRRVRDGWLVAWVGAETDDQITAGMAELAEQLGLRQPEDTADVTATRVRNHLQIRQGNALIVFDNLVSLDSIRPYLPGAGSTQVVVTSTVRGSHLGREVPVDVFDEETALRFLREATGIVDDASAGELAREVGYLPLALGQAAARIRAGWDYATYLDHFRKFPAEKYLNRRDGDPYPLGAATAILIALEPFFGSETTEMLSVLSPDGVARELFGESADDELALLHEASLVEFAGGSSVIMHRLVQRVIRDRCQAADAYEVVLLRAAHAMGAHANDLMDGDLWTRRYSGHDLVRQIDALWNNAAGSEKRDLNEKLVWLRLWTKNFLGLTLDYSRPTLPMQNYRDCVKLLGHNHPLTQTALRNIATHARRKDAEDPTSDLEDGLATAVREFGERDPRTLILTIALARWYRAVDRREEAIALYERVIQTWPDDAPRHDMLSATDDLARAYLEIGRPEKAIELLEENLQEKRSLHTCRANSIRITMSLLGSTYSNMRRHEEGLQLLTKVLEEKRSELGPDHPECVTAACDLGLTLILAGQVTEARVVLEDAHKLALRILGKDHEYTETAARSLAVLDVPHD
ncbi:tetratricopeptide repeat protein [Lentzea sp. NPDC054927]